MRRLALVVVLVVSACAVAPSDSATTTPVVSSTSTTAVPPTSTLAATTTTTTLVPIDPAAWQHDLAMFVRGLEITHPDPYWRVGQTQFRQDVASVARRLPSLNADQATVEIMRLAAEIDGHTQVFAGYLGWDFARIRLYAFEDGIGVVGAEDPDLLGGRLVAIGHTPVARAAERASILASWDNPMTKKFATPFFFSVPRILAVLGITTNPASATYTIEKTDGTTAIVTPATISFDEYRDTFGEPVVGLPNSSRALYLSRRDSPFWWTVLDSGTIYFQYNSVFDRGWDPFVAHTIFLEDVVAQIDQALDENPGARLVIDLRHNGGGDNQTYGALLDMVTRRYGNRCGLFVLIGRATFSAAMNFATDLEQMTTATFIGEPTSGSPNFFADLAEVVLPHSEIKVYVSFRQWGVLHDHRLWLEPDVSAPATLADWNAGRDVGLAAAQVSADCGPTTGFRSGALGAE